VQKNAQGPVVGDKRFAYDGLDLIADLNSSNQVAASYTNGLGIDDPLVMRYQGNNYFYHKNHLGSVTDIIDSSGAIVKSCQYDAYGNVLSAPGAFNQNRLTYTARERHVASGLYYYRARFYDPQLGRFINQDPVGLYGGLNLYAYVGDDPANWVDPYGLDLVRTLDAALFGSASLAAGFGDTLTSGFGLSHLLGLPSLTEATRGLMDTDEAVDKCSGAYEAGKYSGYVWGVTFLIAGTAEALGYQIVFRAYPNAGGGGISLLKDGTRIISADCHAFKLAGKEVFRPHIDIRGVVKHWPW